MPKTSKTNRKPYSKGQRKSTAKKTKPKAQPETVSILKSKYYWATLTLIILVFAIAVGYMTHVSLGAELLMLGTILSVISLAFYIGFKPSAGYNKRATFFFVGACIVGFCIWAIMVLSFNANGFISQIADSMGVDFFTITSLIICLVLGAFIGDLIGKNRENVMSLAYELREKIRK